MDIHGAYKVNPVVIICLIAVFLLTYGCLGQNGVNEKINPKNITYAELKNKGGQVQCTFNKKEGSKNYTVYVIFDPGFIYAEREGMKIYFGKTDAYIYNTNIKEQDNKTTCVWYKVTEGYTWEGIKDNETIDAFIKRASQGDTESYSNLTCTYTKDKVIDIPKKNVCSVPQVEKPQGE